eukprot:gene13-603_t
MTTTTGLFQITSQHIHTPPINFHSSSNSADHYRNNKNYFRPKKKPSPLLLSLLPPLRTSTPHASPSSQPARARHPESPGCRRMTQMVVLQLDHLQRFQNRAKTLIESSGLKDGKNLKGFNQGFFFKTWDEKHTWPIFLMGDILEILTDDFAQWYENHQDSCDINHKESSRDMENKGAILIFKRSIESSELKYTQLVGEGDSSCFGENSKALEEEYGELYKITKEECVGHIQKRMGTALTEYKKEQKG